MENKRKGAAATATPNNSKTKVQQEKDMNKVLDFFRYTTGTTLDCMFGTGVLRNSITWYVAYLEVENLLRAVFRRKDAHTGRMAKYYSADEKKWNKPITKEGVL